MAPRLSWCPYGRQHRRISGLLDHREGGGARRRASRLHRGRRSAAPSSCSPCRWCSRWRWRASSPWPTSSGSSHLGADAVATVGLTESLLTVIYALAMGLGIGATAVVARRIGEKDPEGAARAAAQALVLGAHRVGRCSAPPARCSRRGCCALMGASPAVIATGTRLRDDHARRRAAIIVLFLVNAIFRGAGDAAIAMRVLWLANVINIVLGPLLIFGSGPFPALGVTGAAIATTIGRGTGALFAWCASSGTTAGCRWPRRHFRLDLGVDAADPLLCRARRRCRCSSAWRAGSGSCASSRASAAPRSPATRSACGSSSSRCCRRGG